MPLQALRRRFARFRRGKRPVACGRTYRVSAEASDQYGLSAIGLQSYAYKPDFLGSGDDFSNDDVAAVYFNNVAAMFDRAMLELVAKDPQKGIIVPGAFNAMVPRDPTSNLLSGAIGVTTGAQTVNMFPQSATTAYNVLTNGPGGYPGPTSVIPGDDYVFTPLNSWKYYPQSVWMKFSSKCRRTMYNPTNTVQTVYLTEVRRRRSQLQCANVGDPSLPGNALYDYEVVDMQPINESARLGYTNNSGDGAYVIYAPEELSTSADEFRKVLEAGEMYRRFLYVRFGQYEQLQLQSRGFADVAGRPTLIGGSAIAGMPSTQLGRWNPRLSYNPVGAETTDPAHPVTFGYSNRQTMRDQSTVTTFAGLEIAGANDPWISRAGPTDAGSSTPQDYRYDVSFNPLKNPFLKKLFRMRRTKYVIPPGGSAVHYIRTSGRVNPMKSHLKRVMHFYHPDARRTELPYCLPFPDQYAPAPYTHATRRTAGYTSVGLITQVKGQMVFNQPETGTSQVMQYGPTRVVTHDRFYHTFRACSYGRPVVGGTQRHTSFLSASNTASDYKSMNPTAAPAAVAPDLS